MRDRLLRSFITASLAAMRALMWIATRASEARNKSLREAGCREASPPAVAGGSPPSGVSRGEGGPLFCAAPTNGTTQKGAAAGAVAGTSPRPAAVPALIVHAPIGPFGVCISTHDAPAVIEATQQINVTWAQRGAWHA